MPYPFPSAGLFFQNGTGIIAALYRQAVDVLLEYGAAGDGVTLDDQAIAAAIAYAVPRGLAVFFPAVNASGARAVYRLARPITVGAGTILLGDAISATQGPILRAGAAMQAVLIMRTNVGSPGSPADPSSARIEGLIIDGNALVTMACVLRTGDYKSIYRNVYCVNTPVDGFGARGRAQALTVGAIALGGGAQGGVTITQPDPYSGFGSNLQSGTFTWVVKYTANGATATWVLSQDGGSTFATATQAVRRGQAVNLMVPAAGGASFAYPSGLVLNFPISYSGVSGGTLTFTVTVPPGDATVTAAENTASYFDNCGGFQCGVLYQSSGSAEYAGQGVTSAAAPGTVSITAGSQIVTGSLPGFIAIGAREGDMISIAGTSYPLAGTLNDQQLAIMPGSEPTVNVSGQAYSIRVGGSWFEDGGTENNTSTITHFRSAASVCGIRVGGLHGVKVLNALIESCPFHVGILVGSSHLEVYTSGVESSFFLSCDLESQDWAYVARGCFGASFLEFSHLTPFPLGPGPWLTLIRGSLVSSSGVTHNLQAYAESVLPTSAGVLVAATQVPAPNINANFGSGHTSLATFTLGGANVTTTATPLVPYPGVGGVRMTLMNADASGNLTIPTNGSSGIYSAAASVVMPPNTAITIMSASWLQAWVVLGKSP